MLHTAIAAVEVARHALLTHTFTLTLLACSASLIVACAPSAAISAEPASMVIRHPQPRQVSQRTGFEPRRAHEHQPGGPALGAAEVAIELDLADAKDAINNNAQFEFRAVPLAEAHSRGTDWAKLSGKRTEATWTGAARVPAGGWYRLEVRATREGKPVATCAMEPFGVGEVYVIAGQSYAVGANDELMKVDDPQGRVVAYDVQKKTWQTANDPQPNSGDGGTIWPVTGNLLLPLARVPVGFVNVAVGGTSTRQWLPGEKLYEQLAAAGKTTGRFRAVLWQQGESDVIEHRATDYYVKNMETIRAGLAKEWGFEPPWLLAKSTLHPTVYNDPDGEGRIRAAIDQLVVKPGFRPGPDTDILGGENRGGLGTRRHFSGIGQRRAGAMWFADLWRELYAAP